VGVRENDVLNVGERKTQFANLVGGRDVWILGRFKESQPPGAKSPPG